MMKTRIFQVAAYLVLALAIAYSIARVNDLSATRRTETVQQQRAGCVRTNDLRSQVNAEFAAVVTANGVNYRLLTEIGKTMPKGGALNEGIEQAAASYKQLRDSYKPLTIIDCDKAYPA